MIKDAEIKQASFGSATPNTQIVYVVKESSA